MHLYILTYIIEVWGSTYTTYLEPLIKLQKRVICIKAGVPRNTPTQELFGSYTIPYASNTSTPTVSIYFSLN